MKPKKMLHRITAAFAAGLLFLSILPPIAGSAEPVATPEQLPLSSFTPVLTRNGAALTDLSPGDIHVSVTLPGAQEVYSAVLVAAVYENGKMQTAAASKQTEIPAGDTGGSLACDLTIPAPWQTNAVRQCKVFLLDSLESLRPLAKAFTMTANSPLVSHPFRQAAGTKHIYNLMTTWSENGIYSESDETSRADADNNLLLTNTQAVQAVVTQIQSAKHSATRFSDLENTIVRLTKTYTATQEEKYAARAVLLMSTMARNYDDIPLLPPDDETFDSFFYYGNVIPIHCVYAYDQLYHAPSMQPYKAEIETFLGKTVDRFVALYRTLDSRSAAKGESFSLSNIFPYGLRHAIGTSVILGSPDRIRDLLEICDRFFTGQYFYADGLWMERSGTYHGQVTWNSREALDILKYYYSDPPNYHDDRLGLSLDKTNVAAQRYPLLFPNTAQTGTFNYPDGRAILYGDTDFYTDKKVNEPIKTQYLKNIEYYDGRYFSLSRGNNADATMVTLDFSPVNQFSGGGHIHGNSLGISLWGSGMEVFPDAGYPRGRTSNGFFHTSLEAHNAPFAQDETVNQKPAQEFSRSALLAYDPGLENGKTVQLIEASSPGAKELKIETSRRLLMLLAIDDSHSYVVDVTRLKGGHSHEITYRAVEEEDTDMVTNGIDLSSAWANGTLMDYDKTTGTFHGLTSYTKLFRQPEIGAAENTFSFSWKGQDSGTTVKSYVKGNQNAEAVFARIPTLRRTQNQKELQDNFPNWALRLRRSVTPEDTTTFAAVHETWRASESAKIKNVSYQLPEPANEMVQCITVETDAFTDTIYLSDDTVPRTVDGAVFAGKAAVLRRDAAGQPVWGYIFGAGSITAGDYSLQGGPDRQSEVTAINGDTLTTADALPAYDDTDDMWAYFTFGDGSGAALPVTSVNGTQVRLNANPSFTLEDGGAQMKNAPFINNSKIPNFIEGAVQITLHKSIFRFF